MRVIFDANKSEEAPVLDSEGKIRLSDWSTSWFKDKNELEEPVQEIRLTIRVGEPTVVDVCRLVPKDRPEESLDIPQKFEKYVVLDEGDLDVVFKLLKMKPEV